jgi:hypothetical protein
MTSLERLAVNGGMDGEHRVSREDGSERCIAVGRQMQDDNNRKFAIWLKLPEQLLKRRNASCRSANSDNFHRGHK